MLAIHFAFSASMSPEVSLIISDEIVGVFRCAVSVLILFIRMSLVVLSNMVFIFMMVAVVKANFIIGKVK